MKIRLEIEGKDACSIQYKGPEAAQASVNYLTAIEADEIQVYLSKEDGTKASAEFDGEFCNTSATRFILSAAQSTIAVPQDSSFTSMVDDPSSQLTLKERLEMFLRFEYPGKWFSSLEVKKRYDSIYGKISLSTVSTYLARMYRDNLLERKGNHNLREYRFNDNNNPLNMELASIK